MTGYESKRAAAQDKLAHMTLEQRCRLSEQCLPDAPYRAMLIALHNEMLEALAQPAQEPDVQETLHWHAFNYRQADTAQAHEMWLALERFVERKPREAQPQPEQPAQEQGKGI